MSKRVAYLGLLSGADNPVEAEHIALFPVSIDLVQSQVCSLLHCSVIAVG